MRKIVLPGGSGQLGGLLAHAFHDDGLEVVVLSREPRPAPWRVVRWDGATLGPWASELDGCEAVINLAGRSVNCRYNLENRREMIGSRVHSTRVVGEAIARAARPPRTWLQMSSATVYSHRFDAWNDEATGRLGTGEAQAGLEEPVVLPPATARSRLHVQVAAMACRCARPLPAMAACESCDRSFTGPRVTDGTDASLNGLHRLTGTNAGVAAATATDRARTSARPSARTRKRSCRAPCAKNAGRV
jgi:hypothetical protein